VARDATRPGDGAVGAARAAGPRAPASPARVSSAPAARPPAATPFDSGSPAGALRWSDGFVFALTIPAALVATLGYSIGALGGWGAVVLWTASMLIATAANWVYSELAAMFPSTAGGISLYAHEGWRERFPLAGPIGAFGYWFGWSGALAVYGVIIGELVRTRWAPGADPDLSAAGAVLAVWVPNVLGIAPTLRLTYATAAMLLVPLAALLVGPWLGGDWRADNLSWGLGEAGQGWGGLETAIVWLYVMLWTSLGVEACATFGPEYRRPGRDAVRALRVSALFSLAVFALLPLGLAGAVGEDAAAADPVGFYAVALDRIAGGWADPLLVLVIGGLGLVMLTCMAGSSRALRAIAAQGTAARVLVPLNRHGAPARAMGVDLVTNLALIVLLGDLLAILAAGNLGYVLAHVLALSAFVLLRRDRPDQPRPVRLPRVFVPLAAGLALVLAFVTAVGALAFDITGYGGTTELLVALGVLLAAALLFARGG
jgi:amino acid transporter